ncbi:unnamed protein product [Heterotrigona itama]|uniref:Uncharacterized protein n=1 Tax=Heterotrigona itama TaxID=395501 RepID=A0A6V7HCV6_9HYME|nr:unnamed protein product [Heterotrigona itama]
MARSKRFGRASFTFHGHVNTNASASDDSFACCNHCATRPYRNQDPDKRTRLCESLDEGGLLPDSGGVVENDVVVGDGTCVNTCGLHQHQQQHSQGHRYRQQQSLQQQQSQPQQQQHYQQQRQQEELEDFLCFRGPPEQEMVAQEMAQSYTQLLQPSQEPQEFISLEELHPRIHQEHRVHDSRGQVVSAISSTGSQLYQHHHQHQQQQQGSYYNLSAVQE